MTTHVREAATAPARSRSAPRHQGLARMIFRIFSVLAAILLVGAVALGTLTAGDMTLAQGLALADPDGYARWQGLLQARLGMGFWHNLAAPLLLRPLWLVPVMLGLVCVGCAVSSMGPAAGQKRHRRS